MGEHPAERGERPVIAFTDLAAVASLADEFHGRLKEVNIQPQRSINPVEQQNFFGGIVTLVANCAADYGVVFLFDVAVVVGTMRPAAREGDPLGLALFLKVVVDKFAAVI